MGLDQRRQLDELLKAAREVRENCADLTSQPGPPQPVEVPRGPPKVRLKRFLLLSFLYESGVPSPHLFFFLLAIVERMEQRSEGCAEVPTAREPHEPADSTERDGGEAGNAGKKALRNAVRRALLWSMQISRQNDPACLDLDGCPQGNGQKPSRISGKCVSRLLPP